MCLLIPVDLELGGWGDTVGNGRWEERKRLGIIPPLASAPGTSEGSSGPGPLLLQLSPAQVGLFPVARGAPLKTPPSGLSEVSPVSPPHPPGALSLGFTPTFLAVPCSFLPEWCGVSRSAPSHLSGGACPHSAFLTCPALPGALYQLRTKVVLLGVQWTLDNKYFVSSFVTLK